MKRLIQWTCMLIVSLMLLVQSAAYAVEAGIPNPDAVFKPNVLELQMTGIPLRLPTYVPERGQRLKTPTVKPQNLSVYSQIITATANGYEVILGHSPKCGGGNACRLGTVSATRLRKGTPTIAEQYASRIDPNRKGRRSPEQMAEVQLLNGIKGMFVPWVCGASCTDAEVVWDEGNYRYSVGIKVGDRASLVEMANSALPKPALSTVK